MCGGQTGVKVHRAQLTPAHRAHTHRAGEGGGAAHVLQRQRAAEAHRVGHAHRGRSQHREGIHAIGGGPGQRERAAGGQSQTIGLAHAIACEQVEPSVAQGERSACADGPRAAQVNLVANLHRARSADIRRQIVGGPGALHGEPGAVDEAQISVLRDVTAGGGSAQRGGIPQRHRAATLADGDQVRAVGAAKGERGEAVGQQIQLRLGQVQIARRAVAEADAAIGGLGLNGERAGTAHRRIQRHGVGGEGHRARLGADRRIRREQRPGAGGQQGQIASAQHSDASAVGAEGHIARAGQRDGLPGALLNGPRDVQITAIAQIDRAHTAIDQTQPTADDGVNGVAIRPHAGSGAQNHAPRRIDVGVGVAAVQNRAAVAGNGDGVGVAIGAAQPAQSDIRRRGDGDFARAAVDQRAVGHVQATGVIGVGIRAQGDVGIGGDRAPCAELHIAPRAQAHHAATAGDGAVHHQIRLAVHRQGDGVLHVDGRARAAVLHGEAGGGGDAHRPRKPIGDGVDGDLVAVAQCDRPRRALGDGERIHIAGEAHRAARLESRHIAGDGGSRHAAASGQSDIALRPGVEGRGADGALSGGEGDVVGVAIGVGDDALHADVAARREAERAIGGGAGGDGDIVLFGDHRIACAGEAQAQGIDAGVERGHRGAAQVQIRRIDGVAV
ncbi:putative PE-PGRS family protein [Magnetofaba australis IT-1]|uniref:Putative PE-PGRS family protein n=1 Tax=Magnetofaba australis IT-1 TaxID=1434232 RepID=A0A1Y2K6Y1_9PROT|nr:putative PE-PGRS family protein [Magnetofaba australis IT-1]